MMNKFEFCKQISAFQHIKETDWPPSGAVPLLDGQCCFMTRTDDHAESVPSRVCRFIVRSGEDPAQMRLQLALTRATDDQDRATGTLYARIDGEPFIVDHSRIQQIMCPKPRATDTGLGSLQRAVRQGHDSAGGDCAQLMPSRKRQKISGVTPSHVTMAPQRGTSAGRAASAQPLPPFASLAFCSIVMRFWLPLQVTREHSSHEEVAVETERTTECCRSRETARHELIVTVDTIVGNLRRRRTADGVTSAAVGTQGRLCECTDQDLCQLRQWLVDQQPQSQGGIQVQGVDMEALARAIDVSHTRWLRWMRQSLVAYSCNKHALAASLVSPVGECKVASDEGMRAWASLLSPMLHAETSAACPCSPALAGCALKLFNMHLRERQAALRIRVEALGAQHRRQRAGDCYTDDTIQDGECNNQGGCRLVARAAAEVNRLAEDVRRAHVAVAQCAALSSR